MCMSALWCNVHTEGKIMLSAHTRRRRGNLPKQTNQSIGWQGDGWERVQVDAPASSTTFPSAGYLIWGGKVGENWGVGGVRLGT